MPSDYAIAYARSLRRRECIAGWMGTFMTPNPNHLILLLLAMQIF